MSKILKYIIAAGLFFLPIFPLMAQEENLNKELILVKPYEPSVTDAQKITTLPSLKDSFSIKPAFDYSIRSKRIDTRFDVTPIGAARLQPLPQPKLYRGYLKVGVGTYPNPLAELSLNTLRNKNYAAGIMLKYDQSFGKVKLDNDKKVFAGSSESGAKIFGQKFFQSSYLYGDAGVSGQTAYNYGYDTRIDTTLEKDDIRKKYIFSDVNIGYRSSQFKTKQVNYNLQVGYHSANNKLNDIYLLDAFGQPAGKSDVKYNENAFTAKAELDNNMFGGSINFNYYKRSAAFDSLQNNFTVEVNPWYVMDNDSIRLEIGVRGAMYQEGDGTAQFKIYPKAEFQFTLLKDMFIPFVGIDGYLKPNTFRSIVEENPFITPGLTTPITNMKIFIYAGIKGSLTSKLSYYLRGEFSISDNDVLFVNDTTYSHAQNYFTVVYDDVSTVGVKGEIYYNPIESLDIGLKLNYYSYQPSSEEYAWHKPSFIMDFSTKYNFRNKILLNFNVIGLGPRYAKAFFDPETDAYKLKSVIDFNLGVEYRYTKSLSFFLNLNNFTGAKYYRWNYYPSQRLNAMIGFTYSL